MKKLKPTVVLDPGHGGRDPGAVAHGLKEKDLNLMLAHKVAAKLDGVQLILTRESDIFVSLKDRIALAARAEADIFVSLHANAGGGHGFESFIYQGLGVSDPSRRYRSIIHRNVMEMLSRWNIRDRGEKESAFYVLRYNTVPALLIESLFIDNKAEAALWREPIFSDQLAFGIVAGISEALSTENMDSGIPKSGTTDMPNQNPKQVTGTEAKAKAKAMQEPSVKVMPEKETEKLPEKLPEKKPSEVSAELATKTVERSEPARLFTVQVGAFAMEDNARHCLKKARKAGFDDAFIYIKKIS